MIGGKKVTAVIVTKGDVDLDPLMDSLAIFEGVLVWNNSRNSNRKVFGRYLLAQVAKSDTIYVQDDDCLINAGRLCYEYQPGELLCNVKPEHARDYQRQYPGIALVGWGAIFPKSMIDFSPYLAKFPEDDLFDRECDRVFTWLNRAKTRIVDFGVEDLKHALGKDRMGTEARHGADLVTIRARLISL